MLKELAELHKLCFPEKPWNAEDFKELKSSGCEVLASQNGFIVWRAVLDEAEIITIGVHPEQRRNGIASAMLTIMESELQKQNIKKLFLEVAENNDSARSFYLKSGFKEIGKRPKYYDGKIDAILMEKTY